VHAEGQIVDFKTQEKLNDIHKILVSINQLLPPDIRCLQLGHAPYETFHPTLSAISKTYRYFLSTDPVQLPHQRHTHWHVHRPINMELLFSLPQLFIGTHDFRGFCNRRAQLDEENTVRTIFALNIEQQPHGLVFEITGDNFLYKMVRNIVGTLLWIARGKLPVTAIQEALSSRKRAFAGVTAPAHGLTLTRVHYPISLFQ
jgi:tRNA pseudouridine38-40 synthase